MIDFLRISNERKKGVPQNPRIVVRGNRRRGLSRAYLRRFDKIGVLGGEEVSRD